MKDKINDFLKNQPKLDKEEKIEEMFNELFIILNNHNNSYNKIIQALNDFVKEKANIIALDIQSLAPHNSYEKLLEQQQDIVKFLKEESAQSKYWKFNYLELNMYDTRELIVIKLLNSSVDDGTTFNGKIFLGMDGEVKHLMAQVL